MPACAVAFRLQCPGDELGHAPEVTVTGHSLGGTLAQVSAHHFDLKGETFNAYGAVSLGRRIPEGGDRVLNHVMAADPVSAASPHYGQVRVYAKPEEIHTLGTSGFSNSRLNGVMPDLPLVAAGRSLGSHKLGNFLGETSVLQDPHSRELADQNRRMVGEYRDDLRALRTGTTVIGCGPVGNAIDAIDGLRGPLAPGEPARREAAEQRRHDTTSMRIDQPGPPAMRCSSTRSAACTRRTRVPGACPTGSATSSPAALPPRCTRPAHRCGGDEPGRLTHLRRAGPRRRPAQLRVGVDTMAAMNTPLERSSERVAEQATGQAQARERNLQQERQQVATRALG